MLFSSVALFLNALLFLFFNSAEHSCTECFLPPQKLKYDCSWISNFWTSSKWISETQGQLKAMLLGYKSYWRLTVWKLDIRNTGPTEGNAWDISFLGLTSLEQVLLKFDFSWKTSVLKDGLMSLENRSYWFLISAERPVFFKKTEFCKPSETQLPEGEGFRRGWFKHFQLLLLSLIFWLSLKNGYPKHRANLRQCFG